MESDEEDYVFYGTPIESEEAVTSRKKKAIAEASGQLRTLPPWKQEVRDEEGRRRFHGAFTGGFSAGYYNTVGSKEGWTPQSFTSSRKSRAEVKHQSIFSFLDEDERAELEGQTLGTNSQFDTFGFTAAEYARKQAEKEQHQRPSVIPGPVPDELVLPVTDSIGVKLLLKMGWRRGRSLKDLHANSLHDTRREARKAFLAFSTDDTKVQPSVPVDDDIESSVGHAVNDDVHSSQNTPVYVLNPKQDMHGLGYDPFKHAPEFREKKKLRMSASRQPGHGKASSLKDNLFGFNSGKVAPGFGIGALEELDAEDEDVYASGYNFEETYVEEVEESSRLSADNERKLLVKDQSVLPGFRVASKSDYQLERYDPPVILKDFVAYHKFPGPVETDSRLATPPPEVPPPEDSNLKLLIEGVATLVARCGKLFEDLSREKNQSNPLFGFLNGGNGHEYYVRKLWEEQQKHNDHTKRVFNDKNLSSSVQKMTVDSRGKLLGERPLEKSSRESLSGAVHFQSNLSETFTKPASIMESSEIANPFKDDPAKQERFEQFLKQKYEGGLRSTDSGGANYMSEAARARERLDFEAAAEAIEKGKLYKDGKHSTKQSLESSAIGELQFTSGGLEKTKDTQSENLLLKKMYPKREEFQWRPSPLLCKRFDLIDPYLGKPPPAPRIRSKMDSLLFMPDSFKATGLEETGSSNKDSFLVMQPAAAEINKDFADKEDEVEVEVKNVERPVDLYKAIFSDDSGDEIETSIVNKVENQENKSEAAVTTLNRLMASDFLESLGKELGLEVPPDAPYSASEPVTQDKAPKMDVGNTKVQQIESKATSTPLGGPATAQEDESKRVDSHHGDPQNISGKYWETGSSENGYGKTNQEEMAKAGRKDKSPSLHHQQRSYSSSSEDERNRKRKDKSSSRRQKKWSSSESSDDESTRIRSRRHQDRSNDSCSDPSSDHRDRYSSRSKGRKKRSSREKSSNKKHSKHHKHRNRSSPHRSSHYSTEKEHAESRREKRKSRN